MLIKVYLGGARRNEHKECILQVLGLVQFQGYTEGVQNSG
jgi:hypothetical protein